MTAPSQRFEIEIVVVPEDIDDLGHVNNVVYLRWVQEVAIAHWTSAAPADSHRFERLTELVRAGDEKLLAKARTLWCPISRATGKLTRVNEQIRAQFSVPDSAS